MIIYGGEKVFAAGADIKDMAEASYAEMANRAGRLQEAMAFLLTCRGRPFWCKLALLKQEEIF